MFTASQIARTQKEWLSIAKEPVQVEQISGALYAFGSELATLRLFRKHPSMSQGYSANRGTFYFCIALPR